MQFSSRLWPIHLAAVVAGILSACGDSGGDGKDNGEDCSVGAEGCACTEGGACDGDLACRSNLCVNLSGDGDSPGNGDGDGDGDNPGDGDGDGDNPGDGDIGSTGGDSGSSGGLTGDGDLGGAPGDGDGTGGTGGTTETGGSGGTGGASMLGCDGGRLVLPVIYRDFNESHESFYTQEYLPQDPCNGLKSGIVAATLGPSGKPVYAGDSGSCVSESGFSEWFVDSDASSTLETTLVLFPDATGGHVNRFGADGEKYEGPPEGEVRWCGNVGDYDSCEAASAAGDCDWTAFDPNTEECWEIGAIPSEDINGQPLPVGCPSNSFCAGTVTVPTYDGTPVFFPFDGRPEALEDTRYAANISALYFNGIGWPWETDGYDLEPPANAPLHNFHFTTELSVPFHYEADLEAVFTFLADDDAFIFVNGHLVVDLGGYHVPLFGVVTFEGDGTVNSRIWQPEDRGAGAAAVTLSEATFDASELGLEPGGQYEIKLFDAERMPHGSSFVLSLSGFDLNANCVP